MSFVLRTFETDKVCNGWTPWIIFLLTSFDWPARQMSAFGGMLTFQLKGGLGVAITLSEKIRVFHYATSLGHAHSPLFYYPTDLYVDAAPS